MKIISFFTRIPAFLSEVHQELKKVSWSTRSELINATIVVLIGSFCLTLFISLSDILLARLLQVLVR
ncbi:MAG: preprotein translocase subunit SecE [Candidatus Omnitrophica bacterium]|nr:preprotein translocase subunit SecE [Candidatus Omnitrophota bacterium]